jgi:cytochrome c551/c552
MKALFLQRKSVIALALLLLLIVIVSCTPNANEPIISPQLGAVLAAREAGEVVAVLPTPTPVLLSTLSEEDIYAGLPDEILNAIASADPGRAESISLANGCVGCHSVDPAQQMTGPTWYHIGDTAVSRVPGESPAYYLYQSIVDPGAYVVPNFVSGVMPATFGETLSDQDLADLLVYMLNQHE